MTNKVFWKRLEAATKIEDQMKRMSEFMYWLAEAYDEDLEVLISCFYDERMPGYAKQGYMDVEGKRFLVCYTSKERARAGKFNGNWDIARLRAVMNNMFNKDVIIGMVFNPGDEAMTLVFKEAMELLLPGEKEKPRFFKEPPRKEKQYA